VKLRYLLDTNTLSEPLKPQARSRVIDNLTTSNYASGSSGGKFWLINMLTVNTGIERKI